MIPRYVPKGENSISLTFRNENYYKAYQFQVQAKNDVGFGPKSPIYVAFTGERRMCLYFYFSSYLLYITYKFIPKPGKDLLISDRVGIMLQIPEIIKHSYLA